MSVYYRNLTCVMGGGGRVLLCAQRAYSRRDQLDCPSPNGLSHYLPLNKTGAHIRGSFFMFVESGCISTNIKFAVP